MGGTVRRHRGLAVLVAGAIVLLFLYLLHEQTGPSRKAQRLEPIRRQEAQHKERRQEIYTTTGKELKARAVQVSNSDVPDVLRGLLERQRRRNANPED